MTLASTLMACTALLVAVCPATAQTVTLTPSDPARWDLSASVGWLGGDKEQVAEEWNNWYDTFAVSIDAGRYWTTHVRTDVSATFTTDGSVYAQQQLAVPGESFPVFFSREHHFGLNAIDLSAGYQFLENSWVHPFVGGGVQLGWERHRIETPFPFASGRDSRTPIPVPPVDVDPRTTFDGHPFVSGGAKFYVGERGFIRTELSATFDGRGATRVSWRTGVGVDF